jgi:hypothetical protein
MTTARPMPRERGPNTVQITILVTPETRDDADRLARRMSKPGIPVTRTDVLRAAVLRGLDALGAEHPDPPEAKRRQR